MPHSIRETWQTEKVTLFSGPVEVDETYISGKRQNTSKSKRKNLEGRGPVGKRLMYCNLIAENGLDSGVRF